MIADKGFLHSNWPPISIDGRGIRTTDMRRRRRDLNVGQQSLIRGSNRMTLLRLALPLSRRRASKAHSGGEGSPACPAPSAAYRAEAGVCLFAISSAGCFSSHGYAAFGAD